MRLFRALVINTVFALNVFLLFLLAFRDVADIPGWLHVIGRMHPLLLHLPIGFLILVVLVVLFRRGFRRKAFANFLIFVLCFAALTSAATAVMGVLLSTEGGYDPLPLGRHLVTGAMVSILAAALLWLSLWLPRERRVFNFVLGVTFFVLIAAGHFGSVLTHGENFVWQPLTGDSEAPITDSTSMYEAAVRPILKAKCFACHNERKAKGGLVMTSLARLLKGGKHGEVWTSGDPANSPMVKRLHLPEGNDDHMPPAGKPQPTAREIRLLETWIRDGADVKLPWTKFNDDSLRAAVKENISRSQKPVIAHYDFPAAGEKVIASLSTPFCSVAPVAAGEPALAAEFFLAQSFDPKSLDALLSLKDQLVSLNLSRMPVGDDAGKIISQFGHLEKLNLNQTSVSPAVIKSLTVLPHLQSLSLAGTAVDGASVAALGQMQTLKSVFLWNTKVTPTDQAALRSKYPGIEWNIGYPPTEILKLTPPTLSPENYLVGNEGITLKNSLPGAQIRYTVDGTLPDSVRPTLYDRPIRISGYTELNARTFKDGWYGSPDAKFYFFKRGTQPLGVTLTFPPNKDYKGEGAQTLIDNKKGSGDNFREATWIAFREKPMEALFQMPPGSTTGRITISYAENTSSFIFPPALVEVWGGLPGNLRLLKSYRPEQPVQKGPAFVKGIELTVPRAAYPYLKVIARPVARVPAWISKKPEKGWFFTDEIIFD